MKRIIAFLLIAAFAFSSCSTPATQTPGTQAPDAQTQEPTSPADASATPEPGREMADVQEYRSVYSGELASLNYLVYTTQAICGAAANWVDTLIDYDKYGRIVPCLATEWSVSEDGLVWTFKLREGVKWYTTDGKEYAETTADDFVANVRYILNPDNASNAINTLSKALKNAKKYYDKDITDFNEVGVKAVSKYTVQYTLEAPIPYFLSMLTDNSFFPVNQQFLDEVGENFGLDNENVLYNGAYILKTFEPQVQRVTVKNENYWDKDNVYITKFTAKYNKEASSIAPELYLRGDIDYVDVPTSTVSDWYNDPAKKDLVRPGTGSFYTYFYLFNFDPHFDAQYEPENWKIAVNNTNFRKSLFHGLDREAALLTFDPYYPENYMNNTITPPKFASDTNGTDFTQLGKLADFSNSDSFNAAKAREYRDLAKSELEGKATFPIKVLMPYNSGSSDWGRRCEVVKQQLETLLGKDFIEVIIEARPSTDFLQLTRRSGNYAFLEANNGPDFSDPDAYSISFATGNTYGFFEKTTELAADGRTLHEVYMDVLTQGREEIIDIQKRYELLAEAEGQIIDNAWIIPYRTGGGGYVSSKYSPFDGIFAPFGYANQRNKYLKIYKNPLSTEEFFAEKEKWEAAREEAFKNQ